MGMYVYDKIQTSAIFEYIVKFTQHDYRYSKFYNL